MIRSTAFLVFSRSLKAVRRKKPSPFFAKARAGGSHYVALLQQQIEETQEPIPLGTLKPDIGRMLAAGKPNAQLLQSVGNHLGILLIIADHLMDLLLPLIGEHRRGALLDNIGYAVNLVVWRRSHILFSFTPSDSRSKGTTV